MAARGLLRHPVDARVHHHITNPYHTMRSRHFEFASTRLSPIFTRRRLLSSVSFQAITCMRLKDQGDCETEVALKHQAEKDLISSGEPDLTEFVNKAPPGPMVEVDPKTTFRRFIAERGASLALGLQAGQTATPQCLPFPTYRKWTPNFAFATILPAFFLAFLVAFYLLRPRKDTQKQIESLRGEGKSETDVSININGRKLVKEILKVPESVRTAMKLGADSVNRVKVYNESSHNNINGTKSNFVDATVLANSANSKPTMISLANENVESEGSDNREPGGTPAFGNMADATVPVNLANSQPAIKSSTSGNVELEEIEAPGFCQPFNDPSYEEKSSFTKAQMTGTDGSVAHVEDSALNMDTDGIVHSKSVMKDTECYDTPFQNLITDPSTMVAIEHAGEEHPSEIQCETQHSNKLVDGEFFGEVTVTDESVKEGYENAQVQDIESLVYDVTSNLSDKPTTVEQFEQRLGHVVISSVEDIDARFLKVSPGLSTSFMNSDTDNDIESDRVLQDKKFYGFSHYDNVSYGKVMDHEGECMNSEDLPISFTNSDTDDVESDKVLQDKMFYGYLHYDNVSFGEVMDHGTDSEDAGIDNVNLEEHIVEVDSLSGMDHRLKRFETEQNDVSGIMNSSADNLEISEGVVTIGLDGSQGAGTDSNFQMIKASEECKGESTSSLEQINHQHSGILQRQYEHKCSSPLLSPEEVFF
ncbi:hypothetical protein KP509_27G045500 [Ceratopteris richardii]|uniref:Uncharacterized protein n=1 Tax=Ceratopteris richardii TaxID=49495 RepID=A0A8T2RHL2_CERRI|nr:hypothetical protein KP509_27G045500 [Ceratopteris richardii]